VIDSPESRSNPVHAPVPELYEPVLGVYVGDDNTGAVVSVSVRVFTPEGPLFVTVTVYELLVPGTAVAELSVFVTAKSATGAATVFVTLAVLFVWVPS